MTIKPTKLIIKNIGMIADTTIEFTQPLLLLYGQIRQGKTTVLNSVRWVFGGKFPADIIRHGAKEGMIELHFEGDYKGVLHREFYRSKAGAVEARDLVLTKNGVPVRKPVREIEAFLNPFLINQDFLRNKTELERKKYFIELFGVDTSALDEELATSEMVASQLRSRIGGYGEIDLTKVEPVDASAMRVELENIRSQHDKALRKWEQDCRFIDETHGKKIAEYSIQNSLVQAHNSTVERGIESVAEGERQIAILKAQLSELEAKVAKSKQWLKDNPRKAASELPVRTANPPQPRGPNTDALESKIQEAGATNARAEQYAKNKKRAEEKAADEKALADREKRQREIKIEKQAKLKEISTTCGIPGLEFDEAGNFIYQGTTAGMISDSQIMRLSSELSALYPDGFGLDLIDRGESLGKSIFEFVDRAKSEKKTILATIVGERPATVPPEIGVFVVDNGNVKGAA